MDLQGPQVYYPQARVRLFLRFEEFAATDTPPPPKLPPQLRKGNNDPALKVETKSTEQGDILLLTTKQGTGQIGPSAAQPTSSDGRTHVVDGLIPTHASHGRNGIRIADTLKFSLRFADFPFDPRVIRAVGVEYYLGTLKAEDFYAQLANVDRFDGSAQPVNTLTDTWVDTRGRLRSNLRFQGWCDSWSLQLGADSEPLVDFDCTDNTRILIDQDAPPKLTIGTKDDLDKEIATYLSNFPQFQGFAVQYRPTQATRPKLELAMSPASFKPALGPAPGGGGKLNVWDYITDVCGAVGHICTVDLTFLSDGSAVPTVVIQRPRTLYAEEFSGRPEDPFTGRILPGAEELLARTYRYGINVLSLNMSRNFSKHSPVNIECRSFDPLKKRCLVVRYPAESKNSGKQGGEWFNQQKKLSPGDSADSKWEVIVVEGIVDEPTLRVIAQGVWEQRQRQELVVQLATRNLASLGGSNIDPDVLDLLAGDTVEVDTTRQSDANTFVALEDAKSNQARQFLIDHGYSTELADAYAAAAVNLDFSTSFRVRAVTTDWSTEDGESAGVSVALDCCNFINATEGRRLPDGEEQSPDNSSGREPERVVV